MLTLYDFLAKQFATFEELPFGPLDAAALSQMVMAVPEGLVPPIESDKAVRFEELMKAEDFSTMFPNSNSKDMEKILFAMASNPRFRDMEIRYYQAKTTANPPTQFGAMTFVYKDQFACIAFRGTDQSFPGWEEDMQMMYEMPIPSEALGLDYAEAVAKKAGLPSKIFVVGHSKGGVVAEYVALRASDALRKRIERVYELDAPGFTEGAFSKSDYAPVIDRMYKVVPQDSVVGLMLYSELPMNVTHSDAKGLNAHSMFTWQVNEQLTDFVYGEKLDPKYLDLSAILHVWVEELTYDQKKAIVASVQEGMNQITHQQLVALLDSDPGSWKVDLEIAIKAHSADKKDSDIGWLKLLNILEHWG